MAQVGAYLTCDDPVCMDHIPAKYEGFEDWTEPLPIMSSDESDGPTHCVECGILIAHSLTSHGYGYVADAVRECLTKEDRNPVVQQWVDTYKDGTDLYDYEIERFYSLPIDPIWREKGLSKFFNHIEE